MFCAQIHGIQCVFYLIIFTIASVVGHQQMFSSDGIIIKSSMARRPTQHKSELEEIQTGNGKKHWFIAL